MRRIGELGSGSGPSSGSGTGGQIVPSQSRKRKAAPFWPVRLPTGWHRKPRRSASSSPPNSGSCWRESEQLGSFRTRTSPVACQEHLLLALQLRPSMRDLGRSLSVKIVSFNTEYSQLQSRIRPPRSANVDFRGCFSRSILTLYFNGTAKWSLF